MVEVMKGPQRTATVHYYSRELLNDNKTKLPMLKMFFLDGRCKKIKTNKIGEKKNPQNSREVREGRPSWIFL